MFHSEALICRAAAHIGGVIDLHEDGGQVFLGDEVPSGVLEELGLHPGEVGRGLDQLAPVDTEGLGDDGVHLPVHGRRVDLLLEQVLGEQGLGFWRVIIVLNSCNLPVIL